MKIKRRDGTMREVDDAYILADGESYVVELTMMDAMRGRVIHDGNGGPVGRRPGFLVCDNEQDEQARVDAYATYNQMISQRWRQPLGSQKPSATFGVEPQQTFNNPQAAVAAAYEQYRKDIEARWRR